MNCVEAIAAALVIVGFKEEASAYLNKFSWGNSFLTLNEDLLDTYANCKDSKEVIEAQNKFLERERAESERRKNTIDLPPSCSPSDSDES